MSKKKKNIIVNISVKSVLIMLFMYIIYKQVVVKNDMEMMWEELKSNARGNNPFLLLYAVLLMFVNLGLEATKWKILISGFEKISFIKAMKTILLGITAGIVTPAKLGEYFGRVMLIDNKNNWKGVWATFVSSISQSLATVVFGYLGLIYIFRYFFNVEEYIFYSYVYLGLFIIIIIVFLYYNIDLALKIANRLGLNKIVKKITTNFEENANVKDMISKRILNQVLVLSFIRYIVFTSQYMLMLSFFGISGDTLALLAAISIIFLIQTGVPLPPVAGILARGEIAILVLSYFTDNKIIILSSTFGLWFINILIPAFAGLILIININIPKSFGYD